MNIAANKWRGLRAALAVASLISVAQPAISATVIGAPIIVQNTGEVIATYIGNSAQYSDDLYLSSPSGAFSALIFNNHASPLGSTVNLGFFAAGTELVFRLHVNDTGNDWFTGLASRNIDGKAHGRITDSFGPDQTLVEFEDLKDLPEFPGGFNDLSFSFTNTGITIPTPTPSVPEPGTYALLAGGLALLYVTTRRRQAAKL